MISFNKQISFFNRKLNWALSLALFFNFLFAASFSDDTKKYLWVKSESFTNSSEIGDIIKDAYRSGYDGIFLQLDVHENPLYNPLLNQYIDAQLFEFDPLQAAIYWGNKYDIEIHCWINTYKIWSYKKTPSDYHIFNFLKLNNKSWFARDINGFSDYKINFDLDNSYIDSWSGVFLSPLNDDVNEYLKDIVRKILDNYSNLNGIHLDYLRYKDSMYGFNFDGCMEFYNSYGINPISLSRGIVSKRFGWSENSVLIAQEEWNNFKIDKISLLVDEINEMMSNHENHNSNYTMALSVAVKPNIYESKNRWGQYWIDWIRKDFLDFIVVMNYAKDIESFSSTLMAISDEVTLEEQKKIYIGVNTIDKYLNKHKLREIDIIRQQVQNIIDFDYIGLSIFSYEYFGLDRKLYMKIF